MKRPPIQADEPIVGIFERQESAEACVRALHECGFDANQVGFAGAGVVATAGHDRRDHAENAIAGASTGSVAGFVPGIGPVVAGGLLAGIVSAAPAGAAVESLGAALKTADLQPSLAEYCEDQIRAGRFVVAVRCDRLGLPIPVFRGPRAHGALSRAVSRVTGTHPEPALAVVDMNVRY